MRFKTIYIEITNICNMNCPFCKKEDRPSKFMSVNDFETIITKIKDYTHEIYLHVKGEPLLHPNFKDILDIAYKYNIKVNITTNGTLLKKQLPVILNSKSIRQINISLHSNLNNDTYLQDIFECSNKILKDNKNIYVNYRLWNLYEESNIISKINEYYNVDITKTNILDKQLFIELEHKFIWPTLDNDYYNEIGTCYGLRRQLAILVNGDIVPCCLDSESINKLGNIFEDDFKDVITSDKSLSIIKGFECNKKVTELCKHCNFLESRNK